MEELYKQLAALARQHGARRLVLFGSRARGDNRYNSDVDLAVYGMPEGNRANFWMDCEDLPTLLKFDIVHITDGMNPVFIENIKKDGVTLFMLQKIEHYISALAQLEQAVAIYQKSQQDALYRDGLIQRFEFTVELAWKSINEYLEDQGSTTPIATPRAVLKEAFAAGVIRDAEEWNKVITARNITAHVYDEKTAEDVAAQICNDFLPLLKALGKFYRD